jgi:hypothetical protein
MSHPFCPAPPNPLAPPSLAVIWGGANQPFAAAACVIPRSRRTPIRRYGRGGFFFSCVRISPVAPATGAFFRAGYGRTH